MKNLNLITLALGFFFMFSTACRKDDKLNPANAARTAKEFTSLFGAQPQNFKFNGNVENTFTLKGGTKITIPAGTFKVGGTAVNGEVLISAMEMLKRSAVIFSGTNTNHISGAPLTSDGFIYLNATAGGTKVDQSLTQAIKISIPTKRTGGTQLWEGVENVAGANQFGWQAPVAANGGVQIKPEVDAVGGSFTFDMGNLGWINCDVFYSYANPKTTVRVKLINNPGNLATFRGFSGETFVFFCAKGSNVVAQLYTLDGADQVKSYDNMMPIGAQGKYISFSIKDGKYYYAELESTIVANQNINLTLVETTQNQVQNAINSLDGY